MSASVIDITLSPEDVARATSFAAQRHKQSHVCARVDSHGLTDTDEEKLAKKVQRAGQTGLCPWHGDRMVRVHQTFEAPSLDGYLPGDECKRSHYLQRSDHGLAPFCGVPAETFDYMHEIAWQGQARLNAAAVARK